MRTMSAIATASGVLLLGLVPAACGGGDDNSGGGGAGAGTTTHGTTTQGTGGHGGGDGGSGGVGNGGSGGDPITTDPRWVVDMFVEEALGPFDSWKNVVVDYGAKGDGNADDTSALQKGLDDINSGKLQVLYFPKGTYKITQTLRIQGGPQGGGGTFGPGGCGLIGEDPGNTTLKWAGASGGNMVLQDGGTGYRYERLTFDGSGSAGIGVAEWWDDTKNTFYGGSDEFQDDVFRDMFIGIMGGRMGAKFGNLDSEGQIRRVRFVNNTYAGFDVGSFNALDWWIWESSFEDCGRGVANTYSVDDNGQTNGAGAMYVYRSNFKGSKVADVDLGNNGWFSLHDNVSVGAKHFIQTGAIGDNAMPFIVQNNRVADVQDDVPISIGNAGALMLVDNQIASKGAPFEIVDFTDDTDVLALGNSFTTAVPTPTGRQRIRAIDNEVVGVAKIDKTPVALPKTPAVAKHAVFEVPAGANSAAIQAVIDKALMSADDFPIVHFGKGLWDLDQTLEIPAHGKVQLVGDGWETVLHHDSGDFDMIHVAGPSRFSIRDMWFLTSDYRPIALAFDGVDQRGGRVQVVGTENGNFQATHLEHTQLSLQSNPYLQLTTFDDVKHAVSMAAGPFSVLTMKNGSSFEMSDTWYEGPASAGSYFNIEDGSFTYLGGTFAPAAHGGTQTVTPVLVDHSRATASWIGMVLDLANVPSGIGIAVQNEQPETKAYIFGVVNGRPNPDTDFFSRPGSGGEVSFVMNRHYLGQYADSGDTSDDAVRAAWAQARSLPFATQPYHPPAGASDVTVYRLNLLQTGGIVVHGE